MPEADCGAIYFFVFLSGHFFPASILYLYGTNSVFNPKSSKDMKRILVLSFFLLVTAVAVSAQAKLTVAFKFENIVEGYDHTCRTQVFIDGELVGTSPEVLESKGASFTVEVPKGKHDLFIMNQALYEGEWEDHTIANNYSIDCSYEEVGYKFKKKHVLKLVFDIDSETTAEWKKSK
jgi:hypothetical protein